MKYNRMAQTASPRHMIVGWDRRQWPRVVDAIDSIQSITLPVAQHLAEEPGCREHKHTHTLPLAQSRVPTIAE